LKSLAKRAFGLKGADSAENNSASKNIIIYPVAAAGARQQQ